MPAWGAAIRRWLDRLRPPPWPTLPPPYRPTPDPPPTPTPPGPGADPGADPEGIVPPLNAIRARHGLPPVRGDANLVDWARRNNVEQADDGIGHHVVPPGCRQNCGMGYPDVTALLAGWMDSPGHRANLLAEGVTRVGCHHRRPWWTLNLI